MLVTPPKVTVVRAWTAKSPHISCETDSKLGEEDGLVLGEVLGLVLGESLGDVLGEVLGLVLGELLGIELGAELGAELGVRLGMELGPALGAELGTSLGIELGAELGAPLGSKLGEGLGAELGVRLGTSLGIELGAIDILGPELGTELGCSLGGKITLASISSTSSNFAAYSPVPTAASFLSAAIAVSKPEQAIAVIVHGTFQQTEPVVSSPSKSHVISVAVHSKSGSGQVDRKRWRVSGFAVIPAIALAVSIVPTERQKK